MKLSNRLHNARQRRNRTRRRPMKGLAADILVKIRKGKDVVAGKGEYIKQLNVHYRLLIRTYHIAYNQAETDQAKRAVAELVLKEIRKIGGRFLNIRFEEMEKKQAQQKVMKALKDAKKRSGKCIRPSVSPILSPSPPKQRSSKRSPTPVLSFTPPTQNASKRLPFASPVLSSSPPEDDTIEPLSLNTNQDFGRPPLVSPVSSSSSYEEADMEPLHLDSATPPFESADIDSFDFDLLGIGDTDEDTRNPLDFWAL